MKLKRIVLIVLSVVIAMCAVSCSVDLSSTEEESRTYMTVDGYEVPYEMYNFTYSQNLYAALLAEGVDVEKAEALEVSVLSEERQDEIISHARENAHETIISMYSVFGVAERKGIAPFGDRINQLAEMKMEENRAEYGNDKNYLKALKSRYMTDNVCSLLTRHEIVSEELYDECVKSGEIKVTDDDIVAYMNSDNAARLKQILISFERHSEDEAKKLADEVYGYVSEYVSEDGVVDEAQFDILTDKYGEDLVMFKNRDGYYTYKGYHDEVFESTGFGLEVGHVSKPVRVEAGYSIIMRAEKDAAYIKDNISTLKTVCLGGVYNTIIIDFMKNVQVAYVK